jgi:outer membrane receptor protein involved in Fe transport
MNIRTLKLAWVTGPLVLTLACPAHAQRETGSSERTSGALEEIVVTARKREESLLSVPVAVTGVTAQALQNYGIDSLVKLSDAVPQLKMEKAASGSGAIFSIRGVGSSPLDSGIPQSVALQIDNIPVNQGNLIALGLFDLQQVEVLKGPQALFFGKNSPAGVVSFTSKGPTDELDGYAKAAYEWESEEQIYEGAIGGPITNTVGARLALRYRALNGWVKNVMPDNLPDPILGLPLPAGSGKSPRQRERSGRLTLDWQPITDFKATLKVMSQNYSDDGDASTYSIVACGPGQAVPITVVPDPFNECSLSKRHSFAQYPPIQAANIPDARGGVNYGDLETTMSSLKLVYNWSQYEITSVTSYTDYDFKSMGNFAASSYPYFGGFNGIGFKGFSQELRLTSNLSGPFNFQVGAFYEDTRVTNTGYRFLGPFGPDPDTDNWFTQSSKVKLDGESLSGFFQGRYKIKDNLELAVGARYTDDKRTLRDLGNTYVHPLAPFLSPAGLLQRGTFNDTNWSPEVTLTYSYAPDKMVYAAYKTGYKGGGFGMPNVISVGNSPDTTRLESEESDGFEIGAKGEFLGNTLRLQATAYTYDFDNLQSVSFDSATVSYVFSNAGKARTRGVELQADWAATSALTVNAAVAYNKARYEKYPDAQCYAGQPAPACVNGLQDLKGKRLPYASDWMGLVGFNYNHSLGDYRLVLYGSVSYRTKYNASQINIPDAEIDGYELIDAGVRFGPENGLWELALIGRNLSDEYHFTAVNDAAGGPPGQLASTAVSRPREYWVELSTRF